MAQFIVRVELHGVENNQPAYQQLHVKMESSGFKRTIKDFSITEYHLPPAEYNMIGGFSITDVHTAAKNAADSITLKNSVLVSQIENVMWTGLAPIR